MATLTKRTNILLENKVWQSLSRLAEKSGTSAADLIRQAVKEKYFSDGRDEEIARTCREISESRKKIGVKGKINYKEFINYGRRF